MSSVWYALEARMKKARRLARWLMAHNMTPEVAAAISPQVWAMVAKEEGVNPPGEDGCTRLMVIGMMVEFSIKEGKR